MLVYINNFNYIQAGTGRALKTGKKNLTFGEFNRF